jgi:predicted metallo-beta-lactamase superfamily hydrolase
MRKRVAELLCEAGVRCSTHFGLEYDKFFWSCYDCYHSCVDLEKDIFKQRLSAIKCETGNFSEVWEWLDAAPVWGDLRDGGTWGLNKGALEGEPPVQAGDLLVRDSFGYVTAYRPVVDWSSEDE